MENYLPLFCGCFVGVYIFCLIYALAWKREGNPGYTYIFNVWTTAFFVFSVIVTIKSFL